MFYDNPPDWLQGGEGSPTPKNSEWLEGMDALNELRLKIANDRKYYGDSEFNLDFRGHALRITKRGLTQRLAVIVLQYLGLPYVALSVDRFSEDEWVELLTDLLPARNKQLKEAAQGDGY
jgi:hypothetical protein